MRGEWLFRNSGGKTGCPAGECGHHYRHCGQPEKTFSGSSQRETLGVLGNWHGKVAMGRTPLRRVKSSFGAGGTPAGLPNKYLACPVLPCAITGIIRNLRQTAATPLSKPSRFSFFGCVVIPLCALGFLCWINTVRVRHVEYVSAIGDATGVEPAPAAAAGTAPAAWQPRLIIPGHANRSYEWLDQVRQMFDRREWRVRHVDYENAPFGREVYATSPYRWWLSFVAVCNHWLTGNSYGQSVEQAALFADPLLHILLLLTLVIFVARHFGIFSAALLSVVAAVIFPFAGEFISAVPDDRGLAQIFSLWSVLFLLAGVRFFDAGAVHPAIRARRWFFVAGIAGGIALWISVSGEVPVLPGIALGGMIAAWVSRDAAQNNSTPPIPMAPLWRAWAFGGAMVTLAAYLIEYFPSHLGVWELQVIHPLYGLAWLGLGEVVAWAATSIQTRKFKRDGRSLILLVLGVAAIAALPVVMWRTKNQGFLDIAPAVFKLTKILDGASATSFWAWLVHDGITLAAAAVFLPVLSLGPAIWLLVRRATGAGLRVAVALALGPVLIALGFAFCQLSWWNHFDAVLLVLIIACSAALGETFKPSAARWAWAVLVAALLLPGVIALVPRANSAPGEAEVLGLVERDLARWLAKHTDPAQAVILAPHNQAATLYYYGGLRGLATLGWENRAGLAAAVRILSASTPEEAKELIDRRGITHIVIPSWDTYLDVYARMGMGRLEGTFMYPLHQWQLQLWLTPVAYQLPAIAGFEGQSVTILKVVEPQADAAALSRIAEYFVEMGQLDAAAIMAQELRRFPADLGALVAKAQVELARNQQDEFSHSIEQLKSRLKGRNDRNLAWDRRVSLAVVLARAKERDLALAQVQHCLKDIDEPKLRMLSTGELYRLQVLAKAFGLVFANPHLHQLALDLLPADMRARLQE